MYKELIESLYRIRFMRMFEESKTCAMDAFWDKLLHPRANNGRFCAAGTEGGGGSDTNNTHDPIPVDANTTKRIEGLRSQIEREGMMTPYRFLVALSSALGHIEMNADKSRYFRREKEESSGADPAIPGNDTRNKMAPNDDGSLSKDRGRSQYGILRLANHRSNAKMFLLAGEKDGNLSVVIKMSGRQFHGMPGVGVVEHCYFPDKMTKERQLTLIDDLHKWIETGEFSGDGSDLTNVSH